VPAGSTREHVAIQCAAGGHVGKTNPKVDVWLDKAENWQPEMRKLRSIALGCGLGEELKWHKPVYTFEDKNVVIVMPMKETVALAFCRGALLNDPERALTRIGEHSQAGRWIKFTSVRDISATTATLKAYIREAVEMQKAGLDVPEKKTSDYPVPDELKETFAKRPSFKTAFNALTPGRQRGYLIYFAAAKQSATRAARTEKCVPQILEGKGLQDDHRATKPSRKTAASPVTRART
jgi:uncharacterized protein YdeI (YjbR/CyaY-like superfamily)